MDIHSIVKSFLDIIYPQCSGCLVCGRKITNRTSDLAGLCLSCYESLPYIKQPVCRKCGKPLADIKDLYCLDCRNTARCFIQAAAPFEYDSIIKTLIHKFKYDGQVFISEGMSDFMVQTIIDNKWKFDVIIPVPLYYERELMRGYNQSLLLAECIGKKLGCKVIDKNLLRIKNTPTQTKLGRSDRLKNLQDAFKVTQPDVLKGKIVLLVDDVYTTGTTSQQCTQVLLKNGVKEVYIITLATGKPMSKI